MSVWWFHLHSSYASMGETTCFQTSQQVTISQGMECNDVRELQTSFQKLLRTPDKIASKETAEVPDVTLQSSFYFLLSIL